MGCGGVTGVAGGSVNVCVGVTSALGAAELLDFLPKSFEKNDM